MVPCRRDLTRSGHGGQTSARVRVVPRAERAHQRRTGVLGVFTKFTRLAVVLAATAFLASVSGPALAKAPALSNWHLGIYNSSGRAFSNAQTANGAGLATFHFTATPDVALLTTSQGSQKGNVLGDVTSKTV